MNQQAEAPKIEFPCADYPIKSLGASGEAYHAFVLDVMGQHAAGFDLSKVTSRVTAKGNFQSVTVFITATGIPQLEAIHVALKNNPLTKVVF